MNNTESMHRQFTEPIFVQLASFGAELVSHPLLTAAREGKLPKSTLVDFAFYQYSDSILWIPMLAQMKSRAERSRRLRQAIEDNIKHEAGLCSFTSHVSLSVAMMRSLGITSLDSFSSAQTQTFARSATIWLSNDFASFSEPAIAGWLLTAETLVPLMFAALVASFDALEGCDTRYFHEHIDVDTDEHATWMAEAIDDVISIYGPTCAVPQIRAGMQDAWEETREVPDELYELWERGRRQCVSR